MKSFRGVLPLLFWGTFSVADRSDKVFGLFNIIRFSNAPCESGLGIASTGTCYTGDECDQRGGTKSGSCADGYGVCCTFSGTCGATLSENVTFFRSTGTESSGTCSFRVCKANDNICQLRLDLDTFVISGPSTDTNTNVAILNGRESPGGLSATVASQCLTDQFMVTNPGGIPPPIICGTNSGQHIYVDASTECNDLVFQLQDVAGPGSLVETNRQWEIKVTQFDCHYNNLAPAGCTQYFFGASSQVVQTFNFDGGQHVANQVQNICVRREDRNCRICWSIVDNNVEDFATSGPMPNFLGGGSTCCAYSSSGLISNSVGYDCAIIPGARRGVFFRFGPQFCGRGLGLTTNTMLGPPGPQISICSLRTPFQITFVSDRYEYAQEAILAPNPGFRLAYVMASTGCTLDI